MFVEQQIHTKRENTVKNMTFARIAALTLLIPFLVLATGCSTAKYGKGDANADNDPLEGLNRVIFAINNALDHLIVRPASIIYKNVVPTPIRKGVSNALANAWAPVSFVNSVLQGDLHNAGNVFGRFLINTTAGLGGTIDVAGAEGIHAHSEDFGQTLGVWGANPGFYLVLPIIGPSDMRDGIGRGVDTLTNPLTWLGGDYAWVKYAVFGAYVVDYRTENFQTIDNIYETSIDPYSAIRSLYLQHRKAQIENRE